jgi:hypothetical protein
LQAGDPSSFLVDDLGRVRRITSADCLGVIVDASEFALWLSSHFITNIDRILVQLFKWAQPQIGAYLHAIMMAAEHRPGLVGSSA